MAGPASERYSPPWRQQQRALGELIEQDCANPHSMRRYRLAARRWAHQPALAAFVYNRACARFEFGEGITLDDWTHTDFQGTAGAHP